VVDIITKSDLSLIFSIIGLTIACLSVIIGSYAAIKVVAIEKSTHSVTYMPIDPEIDKANKEYVDQWATQDEEIEKQNKLFSKDLKEVMPELAPTDDDKKRFIF